MKWDKKQILDAITSFTEVVVVSGIFLIVTALTVFVLKYLLTKIFT